MKREMGVFRRYLCSRIKTLLVLLIVFFVLFIVFFSYAVDIRIYAYGVGMAMFFVLAAAVPDFVKYREKHRRLTELEKFIAFSFEGIPEVWDPLEKDYIEVINSLCEEIKELNSKADITRREGSDYYSMWIHQIKTPISVMRLMLQSGDADRDRLRMELFRIEQYAEMALNYLRLENINSDLDFERISLDKVISAAVRKNAQIFIMRKISLEYEKNDSFAVSDEKWLVFVIEQLLSNSLKYTPEGGKISISAGNDEIHIKDNGIGIRPEDLPRVFEKGFTGYNGRADKKSTGIGLYLCRKTMTALGHKIYISSEPGSGTAVRLDLKRRDIDFNN